MIFLIITLISLSIGGIIMFISNVLDLSISPYCTFLSIWFIPKEVHNVLGLNMFLSCCISLLVNIIFFPYALIVWAIELYGYITGYN